MLPRRVDTIQHGSRWTTKAPAPTGLPVSHWKDIKTFAQIVADCARPAIGPAQNSLAICKARTLEVSRLESRILSSGGKSFGRLKLRVSNREFLRKSH